MEQRNLNQSNIMYQGADGSDGIRSVLRGDDSQRVRDIRRGYQTDTNQFVSDYSLGYSEDMNRRHIKSGLEKDNRSNVQNFDSLRNYQINTRTSPGSSSWNEWNPMISDLNSEINNRRPSPEPHMRLDYRTSRNERSPDIYFGGDVRRSAPERYRENINSNSSFFQAATGTSNSMEAELSFGNRSSASSGLTDIAQSFRFIPPQNYNLGRNDRGMHNEFDRNETTRLLIGNNRFEGISASNRFAKPMATPAWPQNRKRRRRNVHFQGGKVSEKRPKIESFPTSLQCAAELINELVNLKSSGVPSATGSAVVSGTSLATGQISGASVTQPTKKKKKKKKSKKKHKAEESSPQAQGQAQPQPQSQAQAQSRPQSQAQSQTQSQAQAQPQQQEHNLDPKDLPVKKKKKSKKKPDVVTPNPELQDSRDPKKLRDLKDLKYLLAIVRRSYPFQKMNVEQTTSLKDALVREIEKICDKSFMPDIASAYRLRGSLMVFSKNDNVLECLNKVLKTLKPWDGASFKVIRQGPLNFTWTVIVSNEFPHKCMTFQQLNALKAALVKKMVEVSDDEQPQFIDSHDRNGTIMVAYSKQKDFEWLKNTLQDLQPWEGAQLRLLDIDDIPVYHKIELTVPFDVSDFDVSDFDAMLTRLERQNEGLRTSDWHLFRQRKKGGHTLMVSVKDEVIEALEKIDYKPFLNLNRITVANLGQVKTIPFNVSEYEKELRTLKKVKSHPIYQPKADETLKKVETHLIEQTKADETPVAQP